MILAESNCRYLRPVMWPDTVTISTRTIAIGETSWTTEFQVVHTRARYLDDGDGDSDDGVRRRARSKRRCAQWGTRGWFTTTTRRARRPPSPRSSGTASTAWRAPTFREDGLSWSSANEWPSQLLFVVACGAVCDRRGNVEWFGARVLQTPIGTDLPFIGLAFLFRVSFFPFARTKEFFGHHCEADCLLLGFEACR